MTLTATQRRVLDAYKALHAQHGGPVTLREVMVRTGLASTSTVSHHRETLVARGLLVRCGRRGGVVPADARPPQWLTDVLDQMPVGHAIDLTGKWDGAEPADLHEDDLAGLECARAVLRVVAARYDHEPRQVGA